MMNLLRNNAKKFLRPPIIRTLNSSSSSRPLSTKIHRNSTKEYSYYSNHTGDHRYRYDQQPRWYRNLSSTKIVVGGATAALSTFYYFNNQETVPFTNRTRFILLPSSLERKLGKLFFEIDKSLSHLNVLPPTHPDSVRVSLIAARIIKALQGRNIAAPFPLEVVVAESDEINAYCLPGGKIVVYTGLLRYFTSNREIASVIGHEVGHAIARHFAEINTTTLVLISMVSWLSAYLPIVSMELWDLFFTLPLSRRMEIEADYIGLLLLASAGYDPRVALQMQKKFGKLSREDESSQYEDYFSTHPSHKERSESLSRSMEEALAIYRESIGGNGIWNMLLEAFRSIVLSL